MTETHSLFWQDHAEDLQDLEYRRAYHLAAHKIATIDRLVRDLDDAREAAGLTKAALARVIGQNPAAVRRLFTAGGANPTVGTLTEVAAALGMQVTLTPLPEADLDEILVPHQQPRAAQTAAPTDRVDAKSTRARKPVLA